MSFLRTPRRDVTLALFAALILCVGTDGASALAELPDLARSPFEQGSAALLYQAAPVRLPVAAVGPFASDARISDVELVDFDGDGRRDLAVAWFVSHVSDLTAHQRFLSLFRQADALAFERVADIDLYEPVEVLPALSVFRFGTADIGAGDFDGDGDADLAVTPYFGDELWLIENLGGWSFRPHLKFMYGAINFPGNEVTPPEVLTADLDLDGRDEVIYLADPLQYWDGDRVHIWSTATGVAAMARVPWAGVGGGFVQWTRGLAVTDFDGDERPDVAFTGARDSGEREPVVAVWHALDVLSGRFAVHTEALPFAGADLVEGVAGCAPGLLVPGMDGQRVVYAAADCAAEPPAFDEAVVIDGFAGLAPQRGLVAAQSDVDGDGDLDLVLRHRGGTAGAATQIEILLNGSAGWSRARDLAIDTRGFEDVDDDEILRPRNLAVGDIAGNTLPEIVAAFNPAVEPTAALELAIWVNSCLGDASRDGHTGLNDVTILLAAYGACAGDPTNFNADADVNKDGCVDLADLAVIVDDYGCDCNEQPGGVGTYRAP